MTLNCSRQQYAEIVSTRRSPRGWLAIAMRSNGSALLHVPRHLADRRKAQHHCFLIRPSSATHENGVHFANPSFQHDQQFADVHTANALRQ